jgi:hypothetical protein
MMTPKEKRLKILLRNLKMHYKYYRETEARLTDTRAKIRIIRNELIKDYGMEIAEF